MATSTFGTATLGTTLDRLLVHRVTQVRLAQQVPQAQLVLLAQWQAQQELLDQLALKVSKELLARLEHKASSDLQVLKAPLVLRVFKVSQETQAQLVHKVFRE
jgi:hypothetical protein